MRLIINIDSNTYKIIKDENMSGNPWEISHAIATGTPIPDNATNGDVLIRLYPNLKYTIQNSRVVTTIGVASSFDLDWWNAPYQKGGKDDNN